MKIATKDPAATRTSSLESSGPVAIGGAPVPADGDESGWVAAEGATRFELGAEIARGGMGRIVAAWDPRHDRKVAIKLLLHPGSRTSLRFANEARITARLQHPAIVAVYDSGYCASGEPFYAMKLVEGRSLADAVAACESLPERLALLPHVIAITDALAYAHARRVIHRDLKPANVLLGAYGETVVIDWGLAKELGSASAQEEAEADVFAAGHITMAGRIIGTPRYMAPEQARGDDVDERTDVYALGALLYHVLCGVPPYEGTPAEEALEKVKAESPMAVALIEPRIPADLAAIAAKAMARSPDDRYPSAVEMAADLKRFAAGQLVSVHSYSLGALARRWAARHAAAIGVAVVLLGVLTTVAGLSVRRIVRERDRADAANVVAATERGAMATQRDAAEKLVTFVVTLLRDRLEQLGRLDVLGGVGKEVSDYYESIAPLGASADVGVLERRASAAEALAGVEEAKHEPSAARALYESAQALRAELVARQTGRAAVEARGAQGALLVRRARFELGQRSVADARLPAQSAGALGDAIVADDPRDPLGLSLAGRAHAVLAVIGKRDMQPQVATLEAGRALEAARTLIDVTGRTPDSLHVLGVALDEAAAADQLAGRFDCGNIDEDVAVREELAAAAPGDARDQIALGGTYEQRAFCRRDGNRLDLAVADAAHSEDVRAQLAERDPANSEWQRLLGQSYDSLCSTQQLAGRHAEAIASCRESVRILERLVAKTPEAPAVNDNLLLAEQRLGWVCEQNGRLPDAAAAFLASLQIAERFAGQDERFVARLADAHALIGDVANEQGDHALARVHMAKVIEILEPRATKPGADFKVRRTLLLAERELADLDQATGDAGGARRLRESALALVVSGPLDMNDENELSLLATMCARVLPTNDDAVRDTVRRAIALLETPRVEGADPGPRLAALARAKRLLGP